MYYLDHIVHFVDQPENMVEESKKVGLHTVLGGKHEMWGTYNSLCYFGLSYIEFIGIYDEAIFTKASLEPFSLHETYRKRNRENGFTRIALRTYSIEEDNMKLKEDGFTVYGPDTFSRTRPDGSVLSWKLLHFGLDNQELEYPFLIQWEGHDEARVRELTELGVIKEHSMGDIKIQEVTFKVNNLKTVENWAKLFNFEMEQHDSYIKLHAPNCTFLFTREKENNRDEIIEVILSGATEEKELKINGGNYHFIK